MGRRANEELPSRLDRSTAEYLRNLEKMMYNNAIETEDQWESMLNSAFEEVTGIEYETCGDVVGSRVVERLLRYSVDHSHPGLVVEHFQQLLKPERYWDVFVDKYGSHVAQTLLELAGKLLAPDSELSGGLRAALTERIVEICDDLRGKWLDLMQDCYASHVGRSLLQLLGGHGGTDEGAEPAAPLPELAAQVSVAAESILGGETTPEQVRDMGYGSYSVPILQVLLRVHPDAPSLAKRVLGWDGPSVDAASECGQHITTMLTDSAGSHLLETVIGALGDEDYYALYVSFFRGQMLKLALDPVGNFVVQQMLRKARQPAHVVGLVGELTAEDGGAVRQLFEGQRSSVVLAAVQACGAQHAQQKEVVRAIAAAFDALSGPVSSKLLESLLSIKESASRELGGREMGSGARANAVKKKRKRKPAKDAVSSMGAQIVQHMLGYEPAHCAPLVQSFLAAPNHYITRLARVPAGSRLIEAFLVCPAHKGAGKGKGKAKDGEVAAARLQKFIERFCAHRVSGGGYEMEDEAEQPPPKRMRGRNRDDDTVQDEDAAQAEAGGKGEGKEGVSAVVSLATDKFGSRVVEALYAASEVKRKRKLVRLLAASKAELEADFHGRITMAKCRVTQFASPGGEAAWAEREAAAARKREMFAEFLDDDEKAGAAASGAQGESSPEPAASRADPVCPSPLDRSFQR